MASMRTLDKNYLATHPEGDEKAVITLSVPLPDSVDVPTNPDGTRPQVSLKATASNYLEVLSVLHSIHDEGSETIMEALILGALTDEEQAALDLTSVEMPHLVQERISEIVTPFRTFIFSIDGVGFSGDATPTTVELEITAPSIETAFMALVSMTKPQILTNVAVEFSPTTSDDDDFGDCNEVLVVS